MCSSVAKLEKHDLKNGGVGDEPENEPGERKQQKILHEINKNIVETPLKIKDNIINEKSLIKIVEQQI